MSNELATLSDLNLLAQIQSSEACIEMDIISRQILKSEKGEDFICFLRFCVARLNKGDSVQAIWHDYLETIR